jgi:hypothetical protein
MSALPPKADIGSTCQDVRFVPKADMSKWGQTWGQTTILRFKMIKIGNLKGLYHIDGNLGEAELPVERSCGTLRQNV